MAIEAKTAALVDEFARLPDWESRYKRILSMARALPMGVPVHIHT